MDKISGPSNSVVLDASVVVKLLVKERGTEKARLVLKDSAVGDWDIYVPTIFHYELCSALLDSKGFNEDELKEALEFVKLLSLITVEIEFELQYEAAKLVKRFNISFYDASYLALAIIKKAGFITADEELIKKVSGRLSCIRSFYDYPYKEEGGQAMAEERIGKVMDYFAKVGVAGILLEGTLKVGDNIHIKGHTTDMTFTVDSMQIDRVPVQEAGKDKTIGIKVSDRVRPGDMVYLVKP